MPERTIGAVLKTAGPDEGLVGSNPTPPALRIVLALIAGGLVACASPGEDPANLNGTWRSGASGATLRVQGHDWSLTSGHLEKRGTVEVTPRRVAFVLEETNSPAFDLYCRETVDVYDWSLHEQAVVFRAVGRPCDRAARAVLTAASWRPAR
jgi:hypothetical protein